MQLATNELIYLKDAVSHGLSLEKLLSEKFPESEIVILIQYDPDFKGFYVNQADFNIDGALYNSANRISNKGYGVLMGTIGQLNSNKMVDFITEKKDFDI